MSNLSLTFDAPRRAPDGQEPAFDPGPLDIRSFSVVESLSEPFLVHLIALSAAPDLDPGDYVGQGVTFRMDTGAEGVRSWSGLVASFELSEVEDRGLSTYEITVSPRLSLLDYRVNCRIFQRQSAPDIAVKLLGEWQIEPELRLSEDHKALEYRVQYHESDLAFLQRLLSEDGISYFFEDEAGETRLILSDQPQRAEASRPALPYRSSDHDDTGDPHVRYVLAQKEISPVAVTIGDFDLRRPAYGLFHTAERGERVGRAGGPILEQYLYRPGSGLGSGPGTASTSDTPAADAISTARVDEHLGRATARSALEGQRGLEVKLQSNVSWLAPGTAFLVSEHPKLDGKRLVVTEARLAGDFTGSFSAVVVGRHGESSIRPAPLARPVMPGMQSAVVVGGADQEIHTDEFGRVRVQFHWDREGSFNESSSCWLRVAEGWAGAGFGLLSLPRVGHEVLVDFVAGNPDEPIIIGRVHGLTTPPAFGLPASASKTSWRSQATPDGDGFHEITFEDRKGEERVSFRSERDLRVFVDDAEDESVGRDRAGQIGVNLSTSVAVNDSLTASAFSAAMGKVEDIENIKEMGSATVTSTLTLREMVPGKITLTTGGTTVQLIDDEIFVDADETLTIQGDVVDVRGGPFVHINPPLDGKPADAEKNEQEGYVVWFELRDKNKKPIPNLECHVELANGESSHVQKTDGQGRVLFNVGKPGKYHLVVGKKTPKAAPAPAPAPKAAPAPVPAPAPKAAKKPTLEGNKSLHTNEAGLKLIRLSEGFYSRPYIDPVGIPTIGYGTIQYPDGRKVTMSDPPISRAKANEYLLHEVREKEAEVKKMVKVPLNENQFSALVSLCYNVGVGAVRESSILENLNAGNHDEAGRRFARFNKGTIKGKKRVLPGLVTRRAREIKLWKMPVDDDGPVRVGTTSAKALPVARMTKHTVPLDLDVLSPQGGEALVIDPGAHPGKDPAMPSIKLKASAKLSGKRMNEGTFRWQMMISGTYKTRMGTKEYSLLAGSPRTKPDQEVEFKLAPPSVAGGELTIKVTFDHPQLGSAQVQTIKGIKVRGKDPSKAHIQALIKEIEPGLGWLLFPIIEQESGYRQFKSPDEVLVGPPAGIGITQRDPTAPEWGTGKLDPSEPNIFFPRIYWDWKENVRAGMKLFEEKERAARRYLDNLQTKNGLPPYTKGMLARETLRRYNGGAEFGAVNGKWKVSPRTRDKEGNWVPLPADRRGYVDEVLHRIDPSDIPAGYADVMKKQFP